MISLKEEGKKPIDHPIAALNSFPLSRENGVSFDAGRIKKENGDRRQPVPIFRLRQNPLNLLQHLIAEHDIDRLDVFFDLFRTAGAN